MFCKVTAQCRLARMTKSSLLKNLGAGLLALALVSGCAPHGGHHRGGHGTKSPGEDHGLRVVGHGKIEVAPDLARVRFGVREYGATATDASNAVQTKMNAVMAALKQAGVPSEQIQTHRLNLRENHEYRYRRMRALEKQGAAPALEKAPKDRFIANHSVELSLTDLGRVGMVLAAVQNAGVNEIDNVTFELKDPAPVLEDAREKAILDAQAQAKVIAEQAGVTLGRIVSISTMNQQESYYPQHKGMRHSGVEMMEASSAAATPIQPGQLTFEQQIFMRYALGQCKGQRGPKAAPASTPAPKQSLQ